MNKKPSKKLHDDHHHVNELHKAMQAAADNYSMASYHPHLFTPNVAPVYHHAEMEA